ncbi:MAG: 4-(cytidine 5'-diphospho)-2-C-methyl-D-erythritol kinase [Bacteroidaceae bacterium]
MIRFKACCKINLGLMITERRPDGYHNLQTVFYPVPLADEICIEEGQEDTLSLSGIPIEGSTDDNLVLKAVRMLRSSGFHIPPLHIRLHKNIPNGAGLGGGSSDAAGVVRELNKHYALGMSEEEMEHAVSSLGADCPFFIRCEPVYAEGIGNVFSRIKLNLRRMYLVIVKPNESVPTREAYAQVHPQMPKSSLNKLIREPIEKWKEKVRNDFEQSIFPNHPVIENIKTRLYEIGAVYAAMSGSGSSVFGLFKEKPETDSLFEGMFVYTSRL